MKTMLLQMVMMALLVQTIPTAKAEDWAAIGDRAASKLREREYPLCEKLEFGSPENAACMDRMRALMEAEELKYVRRVGKLVDGTQISDWFKSRSGNSLKNELYWKTVDAFVRETQQATGESPDWRGQLTRPETLTPVDYAIHPEFRKIPGLVQVGFQLTETQTLPRQPGAAIGVSESITIQIKGVIYAKDIKDLPEFDFGKTEVIGVEIHQVEIYGGGTIPVVGGSSTAGGGGGGK